jgi:hypothetical protein
MLTQNLTIYPDLLGIKPKLALICQEQEEPSERLQSQSCFRSLKRERYHRGISKKYELLPNQISMWKSEAIRNLSAVFLQKKRSLQRWNSNRETLRSNRSADFENDLKKKVWVSIHQWASENGRYSK